MTGRKHNELTWYVDDNGCHICTSHARNKKGYPRITWKGKLTSVHRYVYELRLGCIPTGLIVRHKCDNPPCINAQHLELGTTQDNMADMKSRGRSKCGEKNHNSKLSSIQVLEILSKKEGPRKLGMKFGVAHTTIIRIRQGKKWQHIPRHEVSRL